MLDRVFNYDNGFWRFMGKAGDMLLLSFFLLIFAIPLVTAGLGFCAVYYVIYKMIEHENFGTVKNFFKSVKQNLVQGIIITVILLAMGFFLWYDIAILQAYLQVSGGGAKSYLLCGITGFMVFLYLVLLLYVFPVQARFYNKLHVTFITALALGLKHLPRTLLMIAIAAGLAVLTFLTFVYMPQIAVVPVMFAFPVGMYLNAWILRKILKLEPGKGDLSVSDDPKVREEAERKLYCEEKAESAE